MELNARRGSNRTREKCQRYKVYFNGEEVTTRCWYANNRTGVVHLYLLNEHGKKYAVWVGKWRVAAWKKFHGKVRFERRT